MGFEGSVLAMINTLKNNKKLLTQRKTFKERKDELHYRVGKPLQYKELPESELIEVKAKIRQKIKKQRLRNITITVFVTALIVFFAILIFNVLNTRTIERQTNKMIERQAYHEKQAKERAESKERMILYYLNEGYSSLSDNNYRNAKYYFYKAKQIDNNDFRIMIGYGKSYVYDCVYNERGCEYVDKILLKLNDQFGTQSEVMDLIEWYNKNKK